MQLAVHQRGRYLPHTEEILRKGGQTGINAVAKGIVVVAGDGKILRDGQPGGLRGMDDAHGHFVAGAADGRDPLRIQLFKGGRSAGKGIVALLDQRLVIGEPGTGKRQPVAVQPLFADVGTQRAGQETDAAVPQ